MHALWGTPQHLSAVGAAQGPGTQMLQALFDGTNRLSAYAFTTVKRRRSTCVPGGMDLLADELHPAKHQSLDGGVELGNRFGALTPGGR